MMLEEANQSALPSVLAPIFPQALNFQEESKQPQFHESEKIVSELDTKYPEAQQENITTQKESKSESRKSHASVVPNKIPKEKTVSHNVGNIPSMPKILSEWGKYQRAVQEIHKYDEEYTTQLIACKKIYLMLFNKILSKLEMLSSQNYTILSFFSEHEKAITAYHQGLTAKIPLMESVANFYRGKIHSQAELFGKIHADDLVTRERLFKFQDFIRNFIQIDVKRNILEFNEFSARKKQICQDYISQCKSIEEECHKLVEKMYSELGKGKEKPELQSKCMIALWKLLRSYNENIKNYSEITKNIIKQLSETWKTAHEKNYERLKALKKLFQTFFDQKAALIGSVILSSDKIFDFEETEVNNELFSYRSIVKSEDFQKIACFDSRSTPFFDQSELSNLPYEEFLKFLKILIETIPDAPPQNLVKKRGTFLRQAGTFSKQWICCFSFVI